MKILTFKEWCLDKLKYGGDFKCQKCEGEGEIECQCCDNISDCSECGGDGTVSVSPIEADNIEDPCKYFSKRDYLREIAELCIDLHLWTRRDIKSVAEELSIDILDDGRFTLDIDGFLHFSVFDPDKKLQINKGPKQ